MLGDVESFVDLLIDTFADIWFCKVYIKLLLSQAGQIHQQNDHHFTKLDLKKFLHAQVSEFCPQAVNKLLL